MTSIDWDLLYAEYVAGIRAIFEKRSPPPAPDLGEAVSRVKAPTRDDAAWLTRTLRVDEPQPTGKWFVVELVRRAGSLPAELLQPMLDAAINEVDPSYNRAFVEPCMHAFGPRAVNEYLLAVLADGPDFRKAGAANALYWAQLGLVFKSDATCFTREFATPESRLAYDALEDVWERKRLLLLETFVSNANIDVRRSIIGKLDLDVDAYPESHRPVVRRAIAIARAHGDEYIRRRVEIQPGGRSLLAPLPHRKRGIDR